MYSRVYPEVDCSVTGVRASGDAPRSVDDERMDYERVQGQSLSLEVTQGAQAVKSVKTGLLEAKPSQA